MVLSFGWQQGMSAKKSLQQPYKSPYRVINKMDLIVSIDRLELTYAVVNDIKLKSILEQNQDPIVVISIPRRDIPTISSVLGQQFDVALGCC